MINYDNVMKEMLWYDEWMNDDKKGWVSNENGWVWLSFKIMMTASDRRVGAGLWDISLKQGPEYFMCYWEWQRWWSLVGFMNDGICVS